MKKRILLLGLIIAAQAYASDEFFYEEEETKDIGSVKLEETVIATTGFETSLRNTAANVTIVTSEEIKEKGYKTVEEALKSTPSVKISQTSFGSVIDVRGQGADKARENVKILVDGVNIVPLNKTHSKMSLDSINMDNVESIEVIPGGGAVLYGTGTAGGVINIRTKSGSAMTPTNSINLEGASHGRTRVSTSAGTMIGKDLLIQTSVLSEKGDSHLEDYEDENLVGEILTKYRISDTQDISLKYEKSKEETDGIRNELTRAEYEDDRFQTGDTDYHSTKRQYDRDMVSLNYNNQLTKKARFSLMTSYTLNDQTSESVFEADREKALGNDVREEQINVKPKLQLMYGEGSSITFGYDYENNKSTRDIGGYRSVKQRQEKEDRRQQESHSVYVLNTTKINKLELTQGIRYNRTENTTKTNGFMDSKNGGIVDLTTPKTTDEMENMAYELAANYLYSDTGNAYVRWERGFNTPDPSDIYNNPSDSQLEEGYEFGLSGVTEETYDSFEVGIRDFIMGSYVSLTAFYNKTEDEIYKKGNSANWITYNIDETERRGVEVSLEQYIGKLTLTEGYTYVDAEITGGKYKGNKVAGVAEHSVYASAKYEFTPKLDSIISVTYEDDVYADNDNSVADKDNGHIVTDLIVNYRINEDVRIYAGVNNLFDEKYAESYNTDSSGNELFIAADERNYYAGVNYKF